jgi:hypothetical protein
MGFDSWLYDRIWKKKRRSVPPIVNPRKPQAPLRPPISLQLRNEQAQCPLFSSRFPAELRVSIYEALLGDAERLMHIIPFDDSSGRVGRRRCADAESEGPTWQHKCFGTYLHMNGSARKRQMTFESNDKLMALLLSCHRMYVCSISTTIFDYYSLPASYSEAIDILYTANHFSVKGGRGLIEMKAVIPTPQWQMIRHLSVSTMFMAPCIYFPGSESFPPDNYQRWSQACQVLQKLRHLRSLYVEINMWDGMDLNNATGADDDSLIAILGPLCHVTAVDFRVELNLDIPITVHAKLNNPTFTVVVKQRPYNTVAFPF